MHSTLKKYFGYDEFRPLQEEIISNVLNHNDSFVLMPTGGGKSLCYQLPALMLDGLTIVISPLIALMKDQVDALQANGIKAEYMNSSLTYEENTEIQKRVLNHQVKILYVAPERLATSSFRDFINQLNSFDDTEAISLIAIDEAHCISEWGHDFRPDYKNLSSLKSWLPNTPLIALTATATPKVKDDIINQLHINSAHIYTSSFDRENLNIQVISKKNSYEKILHYIDKYKGESAIIYCFSRKDTENIAEGLKEDGYSALAYHAGLSPEERKEAQDLFIKDKVNIIAATIAFGMGIDKPDVRLVLHHTFPKTIEGYYQEIGRAGRDSLPSECVLLYSIADMRKHEYFHTEISDFDELNKTKQKLSEMIDYCESQFCRRKHLLNYFGQQYNIENCGSCDICLTEKKTIDATIISQKILSAVHKTGSKFAAAYIANVLKGKNLKKIRENGDDKLSVFGIVNDYSDDDIKFFIKAIFNAGLLEYNSIEYQTYRISQKGRDFLKYKEAIELNAPPVDEFDAIDVSNTIETKYDDTLFQELRILRKQFAEDMNVPPFVIFSDVSLQEMAFYIPVNTEDFSKISGVGEQKLEKFGEQFISVISDFSEENNLGPKEIPKHKSTKKQGRSKSSGKKISADSRYKITKEMIEKEMSLEDIANHHGFRPSTIVRHIEVLLEGGEDLNLDYLTFDKLKMDEMRTAFMNAEDDRLKPVFEALNEKYSYEDLRLAKFFYERESVKS